MRDEDTLIGRITRAVPSEIGRGRKSYGLVLGIGDDAAILSSGPDEEWIVSCDAFMEGVHFIADVHPAESVGYKALVRAASDLVAMGAEPRLFLLMLALPQTRLGRWLDEFLGGMRRAAKYLDVRLAGGDTTRSATVSISIVILGRISDNRSAGRAQRRGGRSAGRGTTALTRSGGRAGDRIYVSGTLGRALVGLELVRRQAAGGVEKRKTAAPLTAALQAHLYPQLRVKLGCWLARNRVASAAMDVSDGLSSDLARLCRASGVGAKLWADRIPVVSPSARLLEVLPGTYDPLRAALDGGDDYELLFTVRRRNEQRLRSAPDSGELTCIGKLTSDRRIVLVGADGCAKPLKPRGWDPFRRQSG